jgi:DNA polymerase V
VVPAFINTSRFSVDPQYSNSATFEPAYSTDSTEELLAWALRGLEQIYRAGYRYKKAGVMLNKLTPAEQLSMRLFGDERFEKSRRVMKAVDEINARYGRGTVRFGAAATGGRWKTKFLRRSRCCTTRLDEVLRVA